MISSPKDSVQDLTLGRESWALSGQRERKEWIEDGYSDSSRGHWVSQSLWDSQ